MCKSDTFSTSALLIDLWVVVIKINWMVVIKGALHQSI